MSDDSLQVFAEEAEDLLVAAEKALLNLENLDDPEETNDNINEIFRTFHTIKGAAGLFGLDVIVDFTHIVESVLVKIREGTIAVNEEMVSLLLANKDHLEYLVKEVLSGNDPISPELKKRDDELVKLLNAHLGQADAPPSEETEKDIAQNDKAAASPQSVSNENWHISLRFHENAFRNGMDPASFISYLGNLGEVKAVTTVADAIPDWTEFDPESCFLGFEIDLIAPDTSKEAIEEVFEFVQDDCTIHILPPYSHIEEYIKLIEELPEEEMRIGEILLACGALTPNEIDNVLSTQSKITDQVTASGGEEKVPPIGAIAVDQHVVQEEIVEAAVKKQAALKQNKDASQKTVRVNALKLESLVNLVGELVIGTANTEINTRRMFDPELTEAMENLLRLVEEVRDTALGLRMVQIGETFDKYKRVVREVSRELGKTIDLQISGGDTELDKTLVEKIGDPLMHLIRNAIDHGIESPEEREAAGKSATGLVTLAAYHDSGSVVIRITDDGRGLSKEKILKKAIENGLIQEGQHLSDQDTYQLIFEAGFSTADKISNISGRGVGMDVVRKNIESLRGQVELESEEGKGSTISIRLPLTLAIIDGFQVRIGNAHYIIPLDMIEECIELTSSLRGDDDSTSYINLRGEILPFMHLNEVFGESKLDDQHRDNIVVVRIGGKKAGFVVDELLGEHQTVIKPLGKVFQNLKGISGTTILGSGEVALIIDVPEMIKRVENPGAQSAPVMMH